MTTFDRTAPIFLLDPTGETHLRSEDPLPREWKRDNTLFWVLTLRGTAYYSKSGRPQLLSPGMIVAHSGPLHRSIKPGEGKEGWRFLWLAAANEMTQSQMEYVTRNFGSITQVPMNSPCIRLARRLVSSRAKPDPWQLSREAFQWFHAWWQESERHNREIRRLLNAQGNPGECAQEIFSLKSLANQLGYSPSYLSRLLGRKWKQSPARSLRKARLEFAASKLRETEIRISALASQLGYLSDSAFIRAFRQTYGLPPDQYRKKNKDPMIQPQRPPLE